MNLSFIPVKGTCIPFPPTDPHKIVRDHSLQHLKIWVCWTCLTNLLKVPRHYAAWPNEPQIVNTPYSTTLEKQCRSKWSRVSPFLLHIQHQSTTTTTTFRLLKLSMAKIVPKAAIQIKKLTFGGTYGFHNGFHGKKLDLGVVRPYNKKTHQKHP